METPVALLVQYVRLSSTEVPNTLPVNSFRSCQHLQKRSLEYRVAILSSGLTSREFGVFPVVRETQQHTLVLFLYLYLDHLNLQLLV